MRLLSIELNNFRQFKGIQRFNLESDTVKPVNLIFGANGAGKTTLLNAFTWALYGEFSDDVEQQQQFVTNTVWQAARVGSSVTAHVEVVFDHDGERFRLLRRATLFKDSEDQSRMSPDIQLWKTRLDGTTDTVRAPQERILSILPQSISRFFFFNGERIEKLVEKSAYSEVQQDIKVLLDLEQVERAILHLPKVDKRFAADIRKHGGDKASEIQSAIDDLRDREAALNEENRILEADLAVLADEREKVTDLLRKHERVAPIQLQRDATSKALGESRLALNSARREKANLLATRGFLAFTEDLGAATNAMATSLYERGALPTPLKREFVDKLLVEGECICGTTLQVGTGPWEKVTSWRQHAGLQAVETAWQKLSAQIEPMDSARGDFEENLGRHVKQISDLRSQISDLEETLSELDGKLKGPGLEDVQALESKRIDLNERHSLKQRKIGAVIHDLDTISKEIEQKIRDRKNAEVTDHLAAKARSRSDVVQNVKRALEEILEIRAERMRLRLDSELKSIYRGITYKNYVPSLSSSFELNLHTIVDGVHLPVGKSTGENQILSLSFVAAVSKVAREVRSESRAEGDPGPDSGTYPIVMDAAFGSLDENYQETVARALAQLAPQLVVLVSKSQGLGKVVNVLDPYVSNLGVIEAHSSLAEAREEDILLRGNSYPYIRSAEDDFALLMEIS
ncbi:AAA family ATPase [uncultured Williamsia sp.]|uniref:AAA family ATPase n=1 Tax=uncultured Williamsia sp. TaxID=259311 RepID=UPI002612B27B|nr:AAA family ATPase [uncultured Williamsia sp.]